MRSGNLKSRIAAPSRKNSGLDATANLAAGLVSRISRSTSSPVPTGTVDLVTTTVKPLSAAARRRADRDEHRIGLGHRRGKIGREIQPPGFGIGRDQGVEAGFENRDL